MPSSFDRNQKWEIKNSEAVEKVFLTAKHAKDSAKYAKT